MSADTGSIIPSELAMAWFLKCSREIEIEVGNFHHKDIVREDRRIYYKAFREVLDIV